MERRYFTLTGRGGYFIFPVGTILSQAKLIRDTITGSLFGYSVKTPKIYVRKPEKAPLWVRDYMAGPLEKANIPFTWIPPS